MLRIGITCYPSHGGSGVVATELGKLLAEKGHSIHFITSDMPFRLGRFHQNIFYHEVEVNNYSVFKYPPYDLALASRMATVAKIHNLDLLHVHYAVPHAISAFLAKQMVPGLKVVTTLHGTDITVLGNDQSLSDIIRLGIERSDAVTAVSNDLIKETKEKLNVNKPIELLYNFVNHKEYYRRDVSKLREEYAEAGEKILMHISNFRPVKRIKDVIYTFAKVRESMKAKLLLIGEGPELPSAYNYVKELQLVDDVIFLGKQDEVSTLISLADLILLPSAKESFGLVALEGMACGIPVVGTLAGGIPEVVEDGVSGFLSEIGNIEKMAADAVKILSDDKLYQSMSEASLRIAQQRFCSDNITKQYEELYYRVINETI